MTKPKKPEPNPIEEAIGERAKPKNPSEIPDEPSHQEMLTLEELNRSAEARLQDPYPETDKEHLANQTKLLETAKKTTPVSKPDPQPATKTSSLESPVETIEPERVKEIPSVEDVKLTALRGYILDNGFVVAAVAFHIVTLCSQPLVITPTTTWDFKDRAMIPEMVLALLKQPGYIEGVWPSLKIVMGSNIGNAAWSAGILMTIALYDIIRTLPALKELKELERCG